MQDEYPKFAVNSHEIKQERSSPREQGNPEFVKEELGLKAPEFIHSVTELERIMK